MDEQLPATLDSRQSFQSLGIPEGYPTVATAFSARVKSRATDLGLETVEAIYTEFRARKEKRFVDLGNFARESVAELKDFAASLEKGDKHGIRRFFPFRSDSGDLDIGGVVRLTTESTSVGIDGMHRRLVRRATLQAVGSSLQPRLTRERVRQIEKQMLNTVGAVLKKFPEVRQELYEQWRTTDGCAVSTNESAEVQQIASAAIARIFSREHGKKFRGRPQETPRANDVDVPPPDRVATSVYRILRDTELARTLKAEMGHRCQICGETIELPGGRKYVEAHHIRPLGEPHAGADVRGNVLCVCPNHHAMLDYGVISLDRAQLQHGAGAITEESIAYHNREIFGKVRAVKKAREGVIKDEGLSDHHRP